jgi:hypothetical protein
MIERHQFGPFLRRERERRGVTLQDIATQTKISVSLLAALERNDFSRWPGGIFRRSFVRSYAQAVGLDPEPVVGDFVRLFPPDAGSARQMAGSAPPPETPQPRPLHVASGDPDTGKGRARSTRGRMAIAGVELALVGGVGAAVGMALDWFYAWPALGVGALGVVAANVKLKRKPAPRPVAVAPPPTAPAGPQTRHNTKRRATGRSEAGRHRRARRAERRRQRA